MEKTIEQAIREVTGATDAERFAQMNETAYRIAVRVFELTKEN